MTQEIIKAILDKITEIEEFKYVAENWGQLDFFGDNAPLKYPCCLIEFGNITYSNEGQKTQRAIADISITIANVIAHNTSTKAPEYHLSTNLNFYNLLDVLQKNVHGWHPPCQSVQGNLTRTKVTKLPKRSGLKAAVVNYSLQFVCNQAYEEPQTLCSPLTVSILQSTI
jgi:hypothetical protein